jgi:hypothetical protein
VPPRLTDDEIELCAEEWKRSQAHLGRLGAMAESIWALDWADRLIAEIRRLRRGRD